MVRNKAVILIVLKLDWLKEDLYKVQSHLNTSRFNINADEEYF